MESDFDNRGNSLKNHPLKFFIFLAKREAKSKKVKTKKTDETNIREKR